MKFVLIFKILSEVLFGVLIFILLPLITFTLATSNTNLLGIKSFTVVSGSMEPLIPVGSVEYVFKSGYYSLGDIISFERDGKNITHRIVGLENRGKDGVFYKTKGDANDMADNELVPQNKILGEIMFYFPYVGVFVSLFKTVPGFLIFIVLPTLGFIGFELWNIKKEIEKQTEQRVTRRIKQQFGVY